LTIGVLHIILEASVKTIWTTENFGIGNLARTKKFKFLVVDHLGYCKLESGFNGIVGSWHVGGKKTKCKVLSHIKFKQFEFFDFSSVCKPV